MPLTQFLLKTLGMLAMSTSVRKIHDGAIHQYISNYFADALCALALGLSLFFFREAFLPWATRIFIVWAGARISTYYVGPDNDLRSSFSINRWRGLGLLWWPYSRIFKHRSFWSHGIRAPRNVHNPWARAFLAIFGFAVGTAIRIGYILVLLFIACTIVDWIIGISFFKEGFRAAVMSFATPWLTVGFLLSDAIHVNFDRL